MTSVNALYADLNAATEALEASLAIYSVGNESMGGVSRTYVSAALESQAANKVAWWRRVINFFKSVIKRVTDWYEGRKTKVAQEKRQKEYEEYEEVFKKHREKAHAAVKEAETILKENVGKGGPFKELATRIDEAVSKVLKDTTFFTRNKFGEHHLSTLRSVAMFATIEKNPTKATELIASLTSLGQLLDRAIASYESAVEATTKAAPNASQAILNMSELVGDLNKKISELVDKYEELRDLDNAPQSPDEFYKCLDQRQFVKKINDIPFLGKATKSISYMLSASEKSLKWFEEVANDVYKSNDYATTSSIQAEDSVRSIGPTTLNLLASTPVQFTYFVGRFEHIVVSATPVALDRAIGFVTSIVIEECVDMAKPATPQEETFAIEYAKYRVQSHTGMLISGG